MTESSENLISPEDVETISEVLKERIGQSLGNTDPKFLRRFLSDRFNALKCTSARDYLEKIDQPEEFRVVLDGLTVPETFFFRFEAQLDAFRNQLLPTLIKEFGKNGAKIRIWSAGCCTGEEPYTIALIAAELGVLNQVEIVATDINPTYLEKATNPNFSERSISRVPQPLLNAYFKKDGKTWTISEEIRNAVTFRQLNLNETYFPSPTNGTSHCNLILCRNVLIYFSLARATEIINRLGTCLTPVAYLALGHAEFNFSPKELEIRRVMGAFFFQLPAKPALKAAPPFIKDAEKKKVSSAPSLPGIEVVRKLAEEGKVAEAVTICQRIVSVDPLNYEAYFYEGFLTRDNPIRAGELFQKVLYLNPNHLLARLELARNFELASRPGDAIREYRELLRQTGQRDPNEGIPSGDGITVGLLSILCQRALNKIEKKAA